MCAGGVIFQRQVWGEELRFQVLSFSGVCGENVVAWSQRTRRSVAKAGMAPSPREKEERERVGESERA